MLVGLREYRQDEVKRICRSSGAVLVSYYTLQCGKCEATVTDVSDARARKVVKFDYHATSAHSLFSNAVEPVLRAVLPPLSSPQVVIVVDGTMMTRFHTLLDLDEGLLVQFWTLLTRESVSEKMELRAEAVPPGFGQLLEAVYLAAVELDDNNRLRDIMLDPATGVKKTPTVASKEPTIIEDMEDHFTSLEDAMYTELRSDDDLRKLLLHVHRSASPDRHQIFSFILVYKGTSGLMNSTIQFVSLTVSEVARGMCSTRHCVTTAASLIESLSPSTTFNGTKLSYLLKPALLGEQPALWISCFAPATPSSAAQRETFKESFCIAYTLSRIYSSRVGVGMSGAPHLICNKTEGSPFGNDDDDERAEIQPRKEIPKPDVLNLPRKMRSQIVDGASSSSSSMSLTSGLMAAATAAAMTSRLDIPKETTPGLLDTPSRKKECSAVGTSQRRETTDPLQGSGRNTRRSFDRCSSLEKHPYNCSARYELETYKRVMEPAMNQLRRDIQHYARLLEGARRQLRSAKGPDLKVGQLQASISEATRQRESIVAEYAIREAKLKTKVTDLQTQCDQLTCQLRQQELLAVAEQKARKEKTVAVQTPVKFYQTPSGSQDDLVPSQRRQNTGTQTELDLAQLQSFSLFSPPSQRYQQGKKQQLQSSRDGQDTSHWFEIVDYHQQELEESSGREQAYRNHILSLEQALSERNLEITEAKKQLALQDQKLKLEATKCQQMNHEQELERGFTERLEQLQNNLLEAQRISTSLEHRLEMCMNELNQERKRREVTEEEIQHLRKLCVQHTETEASMESVRLLKESYERQFCHLQQELEELRRQALPSASKDPMPGDKSLILSTPRAAPRYHRSSGVLSPAVDPQASPVRSGRYTQPSDDQDTHDRPSTQLQVIAMGGDVKSFEEFMKDEPSYVIRLPKILDRAQMKRRRYDSDDDDGDNDVDGYMEKPLLSYVVGGRSDALLEMGVGLVDSEDDGCDEKDSVSNTTDMDGLNQKRQEKNSLKQQQSSALGSLSHVPEVALQCAALRVDRDVAEHWKGLLSEELLDVYFTVLGYTEKGHSLDDRLIAQYIPYDTKRIPALLGVGERMWENPFGIKPGWRWDGVIRGVGVLENERRMTELQQKVEEGAPLSDEECVELACLRKLFHDFLEEGERRLLLWRRQDGGNDQVPEGLPPVIESVQQGVISAGKAAYFWGSLLATAVPGYLGRKMGLTMEFLHWNFITDLLILGALPVVTQLGTSGNHLVQLREQLKSKGLQLGLVLACLEDAEIRGFGIQWITFADESSWHRYISPDVGYTHMPMTDTTACVAFQDVLNAVEQMHRCISEQGRAVYVHCKAGKGRSWMVAMCYLTTFGGYSFEQAETLIRENRLQVNPSESQRTFASEFASRLQERKQ